MGAFAVIDAAASYSGLTLSNGNLTAATDTNSRFQNAVSDIGKSSSGKYYWEITADDVSLSGFWVGVVDDAFDATTDSLALNSTEGYGFMAFQGDKIHNSSQTSYGNSYTDADVIGIALDLDNGKIWFSKNGTWQNSGDPAAGTGEAFSGLSGSATYLAGVTMYGSNNQFTANFGETSFQYTPPTGFESGISNPNVAVPAMDWSITYNVPELFNGKVTFPTALDFGISFVAPQTTFEITTPDILTVVYELTLTGAADSTTDLSLPISNFQSRRRTGQPSYLSVTVPNGAAYISEINARSNGELVLKRGYKFPNGSTQVNEIARVGLDTIREDQGSSNYSLTLSGNKTITFGLKSRTLTGASYRTTTNGLRRYRCTPDNFLNPGDTVTINNETFTIDYISIIVSSNQESMEITEG